MPEAQHQGRAADAPNVQPAQALSAIETATHHRGRYQAESINWHSLEQGLTREVPSVVTSHPDPFRGLPEANHNGAITGNRVTVKVPRLNGQLLA